MKIDSVHAEFMSGNAVSSTTSSHSIVSRDASGDIQAAGVTIAGNSDTLFSYTDGTRTVYGGCNSDDPWFGTGSNHDLRLVTNGNERMRIDNTGNVAIGTDSPSHALNVTAASGDAEVHIQAQGNAGDSILYFNGASANQRKCAIISSNVAPASYCKQDLHFCMETTSDLSDVDITDSKMVLTNAGNVGIGTTSPIGKLDVRGAIIAPVVLYSSNQDEPYLVAGTTAYNGDPSGTENWNLHGIQHRIKVDSGGVPRITVDMPSGGEVFSVVNGGNIGIGTPTPDTKLTVSTGSITTSAEIAKFHSNYDNANNGYLIIEENNHTPNDNDWTGYGTRIQKKTDSTDQGYIEFNPVGGQYSIAFGNDTTEYMRIEYPDGHVGIGTSSPQEKFHLYGSPIIQHETRYNAGGTAGWYKIGTWDAASTSGARLKISLLGSEGYSAQDRARGGETIIYASINNNNPTTTSNMSGSIHAHGRPVITQAKFKQVGTDRTQYEIIAYVKTYTQHSMKIECSETTTFTRAWTSASDPGADSATVQAALFTHVVDKDGNVGINDSSPAYKLSVQGSFRVHGNTSTFGSDGLLHINSRTTTYGSETVALQTTIDGRALTESNPGTHGSEDRNVLALQPDGGYVGIGLINPGNTLDVRGGVAVSYADGNAMIIDGGGTVRRHYIHNSVNHGAGLHFTSNTIFPTDYAGGYSNGDINWGSSTYRWNVIYTEYLNATGGTIYCDPNTNSTGSPTNTGVYVYNSGTGDACVAVRVKDLNAGDPYISFDVASEAGWSLGMDNSDDNKFKLANSWSHLTTNTKLTVTTGGNVGIGTTTPYSKLHIHGGDGQLAESNGSTMQFAYDVWTWRNTSSSGWSGAMSIYATDDIASGGYILSSDGIISSSDERIKKNIVDADDTECLEALRLLKPKKYQYKDIFKKGEEPVWGFIAQEVRDTLPYATQMRRDVIPNIYELANVSSSNVITFTNFNTSNLEANATTLIKVTGIDDKNHDIHLVEVIDEHTIRVEEDLTAWTGSVDETGNVVAGNQLFVHGQQVDDFVYLKKESIFTVATAALQEVDRQLQAEKARNDALERRIEELESMVSLIKLNMTWPDA